jgi:hypothetical protein
MQYIPLQYNNTIKHSRMVLMVLRSNGMLLSHLKKNQGTIPPCLWVFTACCRVSECSATLNRENDNGPDSHSISDSSENDIESEDGGTIRNYDWYKYFLTGRDFRNLITPFQYVDLR